MALAPGTRLGSYEIIALLGAGGMGEVYRAKDAKLNRDVAIKVLPAHLSDDPGARARFEREAKAVAALSHPNILAVHDFGVESGTAFVVMELLEGETLRERLNRGALPVKRALQIARDVTQGLAAAHDKGIVHRDIKPENVFLTSSGLVKVLDFGLARQSNQNAGAAAQTTAMHLTDPGTVLGTVAYMSPEQVRGEVTDHRSDLFSLGCVLFESVSGRRPFDRHTSADTMTAILRDDPPDFSRPDGSVVPVLDDLVRHALEKRPEERFQSARDLAFALQSLGGGSGTISQPAVATVPAVTRRKIPPAWIVTALALVAAIGAWWWAMRSAPTQVWTAARLGGPTQSFGPRLSPDGQLLAFVAFVDQVPQVAVMKPDGSSWTVLTHDHSAAALTVAWAPDSSRIYFDRMGAHPLGVYSILPLGGEPRPLLDSAFGPEPLPDGSLIVVKLTDQGDDQLFHFWPDTARLEALPAFMPQTDTTPMLRAFPDGRELVFYGMSEASRTQIARLLVYDLATRTTRELSPDLHLSGRTDWSPLAVSPDGQSVYALSDVDDTRILEQIDSRTGRMRPLLSFPDSAAPVTVDAPRDGSLYLDLLLRPRTLARVSSSGALFEEAPLTEAAFGQVVLADGQVLIAPVRNGKRRLAVVSGGAEPRALIDTAEETSLPATVFGDEVAFNLGSGADRHIAIATLRDGRILRRFSARADDGLAASLDGKTLYYASAGGIWSQPVDGGDPARITDGEDVVLDPQGQHLYVRRSLKNSLSLYRMSLRGTEVVELPLPPPYQLAQASLSPAAVDARGRILLTVIGGPFYYKTGILDSATKSFTMLPVAIEGDVSAGGWTSDGHIVVGGQKYLISIWRYQRVH